MVGRSSGALHLRLPATSANVGPGFDAAAVALSCFLEIEAQPAETFQIAATGRDAARCSVLEDNLIFQTYQRLLAPAQRHDQLPAPPGVPDPATIPVLEPLTKREREVLRHLSGMLNTAEVASEMYISINTVKAHLKSINRKLATAHRRQAIRRARQLELL